MLAHRPGKADDLGRPLTLHGQRRQQRGERGGLRAPFHDFTHGGRGLVGGEVLVTNELLEQRREHHRSRKLRRMRLPSSVSTDSGWNCTPWTGYFRWRTPMIV